MPRKVAGRPVAPAEPLFCLETAIKLLAWSWVGGFCVLGIVF